ncbi:hypothetical protein SAMN05216593_101600 [Pseudomonas asturiensis]|uniref:Uncharacterized protein n=1 Tax=Pseudomonas asturiensis TaxID=1190415 RepID=A0A1M7JXA0_9PSED|nr:hypothetical protein [Pseudomonas asturiensis]SHM57541.1 hypothetical protein SAMN05216593_101600 [Pseudomonas asturiensis]
MARSLLPLAATLFMVFTVTNASASDHSTPSPSTSSELRTSVDTKREQITGANAVKTQGSTGEQKILDLPIETADAPSADEDN